ncbi:MAG: hypothetical protein WC701_12945 [Kiritimatiellales bacterium]|jgi:hypothetical protein
MDKDKPLSILKIVLAAATFLLFGALCLVGSFYLSLIAVGFVIYRGHISSWGMELIPCLIGGPIAGGASYLIALAWKPPLNIASRFFINALLGIGISMASMLILYFYVTQLHSG